VSLRTARKIAFTAALFSLALGYAHFHAIRAAPQFKVPVLDEAAYDNQAMGILEGKWPAGKVFYQDPLYPYFLASVYRVIGHRPEAVKFIQVFIGSAVVLLIFGIARRAFGPGVGVVAALIAVFYRPLFFFEGVLTKEVLSLALLGASLLTLLWAREKSRAWKWVIPGALLGAACLARANLLLMIPAWGIWIVLTLGRKNGWKHSLAAVAFFTAGAFAAISPATIHNVRAGNFVLITSQGGQNFYIGNHPGNKKGTYKSPPFVRANPIFEEADFRREAEKITMPKMKPSEISRFFYIEAWNHIKEAPGVFVRRLGRKVELVINNFEVSDNLNFYFFKKRYSWVLRLPTPGWGFMSALAMWGGLVLMAGFIRPTDDGKENGGLEILILALVYSSTLVAYYVFARYRLPLLVATAPLAAFGLKSLWKFMVRSRRRYFVLGLLSTALLLVWTHRTIIKPHFDVAYYQTGNCFVKLGRLEEAEKEYREAILLAQGVAPYHVNLAGVLYEQGKHKEALDEYLEAIELQPRYVKAHIGAARSYSALGMHENAILHYQLVLIYGGESPSLWTQAGKQYLALGRLLEAVSSFQKALSLDPDNKEAKKLLEEVGRSLNQQQ